jgi:hypothetical protein
VTGAPFVGVLTIPGMLACPGGVAHMVKEQMMAANAKSKAAATLLSFRFIDVFLLVLVVPFG